MGVAVWMREERGGKTNGSWNGCDLHSQPIGTSRSIIKENDKNTMKHTVCGCSRN